MKKIVSIHGPEIPKDKRLGLARLYPEGMNDLGFFKVWLYEEDARVQSVLKWFDEHGYRPWPMLESRVHGVEYTLSYIREYELSDFDQAEYAEFWPADVMDRISHCDRDEQGRLKLERPTLKDARRTGLDFATATHGRMLVLQQVRDLLLEGNFRHLFFRPTVLVKGRGTGLGRAAPIRWEDFKVSKPWWELTSDLILPPLSPSMDLRDDKGNPIAPSDCSKGCNPRDGFYNHAELHYRRGDLAKVDPFDVALTFENFGTRGHTETRGTIVSKRFYDYCQHKGLKGRWAPVKIDEE